MATLAVFIALGGSSYAAFTISGRNIKDRSIAGRKLRHNTLTGAQIKESRLGRVPRAANADRLTGVSAADLKIRCPSDTFPIADVCVERDPRPATAYGSAVLQCLGVGTPSAPGRRAYGGPDRGPAGAGRRADIERLPVELEYGPTRRAVRHRSSRQRRRDPGYRGGGEGVPMRDRPTQLSQQMPRLEAKPKEERCRH